MAMTLSWEIGAVREDEPDNGIAEAFATRSATARSLLDPMPVNPRGDNAL